MKKQMASSNENLQLEADETANVLRVRYVGHVSARSMEAAFLGAGRILDLMRPRFLVLTDMSRVEAFEKMCVPYIGKLMDLFMEKGLGSVVRAVPDPTKAGGAVCPVRGQVQEHNHDLERRGEFLGRQPTGSVNPEIICESGRVAEN